MGRKPIYSDAAERQRAYRDRVRQQRQDEGLQPGRTQPLKRQRPPSRPARLSALIDQARDLLEEYESWLERLPENQETAQHVRVQETLEQLGAVVDLLEDIVPPRGFGLD